MIRRAAASRIGSFATVIDKQNAIQELLPVFRSFC
jgi:hypothetical protein